MIVAVVSQIAIFHGIALFFDCVLAEVFRINLLDQLFELLALDIGVARVVRTGSFNDVRPVLFASTFESSSSELTEDLPSSVFEQVITIAELEEMLFEFDEQFRRIAVAKRVDIFLDFSTFGVLESGLDSVFVSVSTLDLEDGF